MPNLLFGRFFGTAVFVLSLAACQTVGKPPKPTNTLQPIDASASQSQREAAIASSDVDSPRWTVMTVFIGPSGEVASIKVKQSSGSPKLDDAAMRYIQGRWRWKPPEQGDSSAPAQTVVAIKWVPKH